MTPTWGLGVLKMEKSDLCGGSERAREDGLHFKKKPNMILFFYACRTDVGHGKHRSHFICILKWRGQGERRKVRWKCILWDQHEDKECVVSQDEKTVELEIYLALSFSDTNTLVAFVWITAHNAGCSLFDLWDSVLFLKITRLKNTWNSFSACRNHEQTLSESLCSQFKYINTFLLLLLIKKSN